MVAVSNDIGNKYAGTVTIIPITSKNLEKIYPFEIYLPRRITALKKNSKAKAGLIWSDPVIPWKIKALPAPFFKIKRYGEVRFKNDCPQDYAISESQITYDADYTHENWVLRGENAVLWNDFAIKTNT